MNPIKLVGQLTGIAVAASLLSSAAFAQDINVAVAGPMTGGESAFGRQMKNGADQAVADINAAGGVLGKKLALQVGDDAQQGRLPASARTEDRHHLSRAHGEIDRRERLDEAEALRHPVQFDRRRGVGVAVGVVERHARGAYRL